MTVHVDEMTSHVEVEPDTGPAGGGTPPAGWGEIERLRRARHTLACWDERTRAEGFDD